MRNVVAPINKLPPEILTHVCTFAPDTISDLAHLCAQVCRYWRTALLASPSLWNEIVADDPLHLNVHLARSGEVPLEVWFHGRSSANQFCQKVAPHLDRIRLLYLSLHEENCEQIFGSLGAGRATLLREFQLKKGSTGLDLSAPVMMKMASFAADITILALWNVDTNLSSLKFPRLLYFSLTTEAEYDGPQVSDVIGFLRGSPALEVLDFHLARCSDMDETSVHIEPITLQHLKHAILGGRSPPPPYQPLPYIDVDLLPHIYLPPAGQCSIDINPANGMFPHDTNYLLTLIRAWKFISGSEDGFGGGAGFTHVKFSIEESPSTLAGWLGVVEQGDLRVAVFGPEGGTANGRPSVMPDWEVTTTDGEFGAGEGEIQAQLSRLGCYLDPLRWSPSPLATLKGLIVSGFGYTRNKGKYLQYLRECFRGLGQIRHFQAEETNLWMVTHLLRPFEDGLGGMVLIFPLLESLSFHNCTFAGLPLPALLEATKERAALGNLLETVSVDDEMVDLSELRDIQGSTT